MQEIVDQLKLIVELVAYSILIIAFIAYMVLAGIDAYHRNKRRKK